MSSNINGFYHANSNNAIGILNYDHSIFIDYKDYSVNYCHSLLFTSHDCDAIFAQNLPKNPEDLTYLNGCFAGMEIFMFYRRCIVKLVVALIVLVPGATIALSQAKQLLKWQEDLNYVMNLPDEELAPHRDAVIQIRTGVEFWIKLHPGTTLTLASAPPQPWDPKQIRTQVELLRDTVRAIMEDEPERSFELGMTTISVTAQTSPLSPITDSIDYKKIIDFHATNLVQSMQYLPGVSIDHKLARNQQGVMIRGFDTRQVSMYLDSIPLYAPYDGYADMSRFLTSDIAEIEVAKGYSSPLLGPNGLGGAINMISRQPEKKFEGDAIIGTGSGNLLESGIHLGSRWNHFFLRGGMDWLETDYFPISGDFPLNTIQPNYHRVNSYQRDIRYMGRLGWTPRRQDQYVITYSKQKADYGAPPYSGIDLDNNSPRYWKWPYWNRDSYYFNSNTGLGESHSLKFRVFYDLYPNDLTKYSDSEYSVLSASTYNKDHSAGFSSQFSTRMFPRHALSASFLYKADNHRERDISINRRGVETIEPWHKDRDQLLSVGFQDVITISERMQATAGFSADNLDAIEAQDIRDNAVIPFDCAAAQASGDPNSCLVSAWAYNPLASLSYSISKSGTLFVTFAVKSHFPTLKDRYSYKNGKAIPNPTLQPEHSRNWTLGYAHAFAFNTMMQVELFRSDVYDAIRDAQFPSDDCEETPGFCRQSVNIGKEVNQGVEFTIRSTPIPRLTLDTNYTFLNRKITGPTNMFDVFPTGTPKHRTVATAKVRLPRRIMFLASARYESGTTDTNDTGIVVPASKFATADLGGIVPIYDDVHLQAGVNNLFDRNYYYKEGYPEPGRTWYVNMRYRF